MLDVEPGRAVSCLPGRASTIKYLHRDMGSEHLVGPDPKGVTARSARSQDGRVVGTQNEIFAVDSCEAERARSGLIEVISKVFS